MSSMHRLLLIPEQTGAVPGGGFDTGTAPEKTQ